MTIRLKSAGKTDVGLKRSENEDNFIMLPDHGLYVVADGMGGHASGKVASTLTVTHVTEFVCSMAKQPGFDFPYGREPGNSFEANVLVNAIKYANERVFIQSCKDRAMEGMGTTITAILTTPQSLVLAHVGDSRIYRLRAGELAQLTVDHSLLNHLISIGEVKAEDAKKFANKNVILRAIGLKDYVDVSVQEVDKVPGDLYMMCSDGLSDLVEDFVIREVLKTAPSLPDACNQLIKLALHAGGKDNVTVVCVEVEAAGDRDEVPGRWNTGAFVPPAPPQNLAHSGVHPAIPPPRAQRGMAAPPPMTGPSPRVEGLAPPASERMHSVRMPRNSKPRGQGVPPTGLEMPPPPRRQTAMPPQPLGRRGRSGTPPAPIDAVDPLNDDLERGLKPGAPTAAPPWTRSRSDVFPAPETHEAAPPRPPAAEPAPPPPGSFVRRPQSIGPTAGTRPLGFAPPTPPPPPAAAAPAAGPPSPRTLPEVRTYPPPSPRLEEMADSEGVNLLTSDDALEEDFDEGEYEPTILEMPVLRVDPKADAAKSLASPMSGEGVIKTRRPQQPETSVMVDESLLMPSETSTIVVDDSLFDEMRSEAEHPTQRLPASRKKP